MNISIISSKWDLFETSSGVSVSATTLNGDVVILPKHVSYLGVLKPSVLKVIHKDKNNMSIELDYAIWSGILEVSSSEVKIIIDMLVWIDDLDIDAAEVSKQKALELMEKYRNSKDRVDMDKFIEAENLLLKSIAQIKLWDKR